MEPEELDGQAAVTFRSKDASEDSPHEEENNEVNEYVQMRVKAHKQRSAYIEKKAHNLLARKEEEGWEGKNEQSQSEEKEPEYIMQQGIVKCEGGPYV